MQAHTLKPDTKIKSEKRVGRGGKRGKTSGKGMKGQKSRAGHRIRPATRDILIRIPKLRGFNNKPKSSGPKVLDLKVVDAKIKGGAVTLETLRENGLIEAKNKAVKIIGNSEVSSKLSVKGISVSAGAKKKIEEKGGSVE